jgi:hypothetical protein
VVVALESPGIRRMRRALDFSVFFIVMIWCARAFAQSNSPASPADVGPETAFISPSTYTNAFFGFSLKLPNGVPFREVAIPPADSSRGFLFGVEAGLIKGAFNPHAVVSLMTIVYKRSESNSAEEAQKFVAGTKNVSPTPLNIGGKDFWKNQFEDKGKLGKVRTTFYATALGNYAIEIAIGSDDAKLTTRLEHSIESITFFDPPKAAEIAGSGSRLYDPSGRHIARLNSGTVWAHNYLNADLGLAYEFPSGWVAADQDTRARVIEDNHQSAWGNNASAAEQHLAIERCTRYVSIVNRYPAGTKTEEVNPGIALLVIDPACFPPDIRFPSAVKYDEGLTQLSKAMLAILADAPFFGNAPNFRRLYSDAGHIWIELSSTANVKVSEGKSPLTAYTVIELTAVQDYWVAWMFMAGSQSELDQLRRTRISLNSAAPIL